MRGEEQFVWDDASVERLKALLADGATFNEVAIALNVTSRAAIAGKANRLGLTKKHKQKPIVRKCLVLMPDGNNQEHVVSITPTKVPIHTGEAVMALRTNQCRFPIGNPFLPGFYFCNAVKTDDSSYCPYHKSQCIVQRSTLS